MSSIAEQVISLQKSSIYRFGDRLGFSVPITAELTLPGRHDPIDYVRDFTSPGRALVVCPGNGGIATQLLLQGASSVVVIEPRDRFHDALKAVVKLFIEAHPGNQVEVFTDFPTTAEHVRKLGYFDSIVWFEGTDEIGDPEVVQQVARTLKSTGRMKIEVAHGTSTHMIGKINNWRPTVECFAKCVEHVGAVITAPSAGRLGTTKIFTVTAPSVLIAAQPAPEPTPVVNTAPAMPLPTPPPPPRDAPKPFKQVPTPPIDATRTDNMTIDNKPSLSRTSRPKDKK